MFFQTQVRSKKLLGVTFVRCYFLKKPVLRWFYKGPQLNCKLAFIFCFQRTQTHARSHIHIFLWIQHVQITVSAGQSNEIQIHDYSNPGTAGIVPPQFHPPYRSPQADGYNIMSKTRKTLLQQWLLLKEHKIDTRQKKENRICMSAGSKKKQQPQNKTETVA